MGEIDITGVRQSHEDDLPSAVLANEKSSGAPADTTARQILESIARASQISTVLHSHLPALFEYCNKFQSDGVLDNKFLEDKLGGLQLHKIDRNLLVCIYNLRAALDNFYWADLSDVKRFLKHNKLDSNFKSRNIISLAVADSMLDQLLQALDPKSSERPRQFNKWHENTDLPMFLNSTIAQAAVGRGNAATGSHVNSAPDPTAPPRPARTIARSAGSVVIAAAGVVAGVLLHHLVISVAVAGALAVAWFKACSFMKNPGRKKQGDQSDVSTLNQTTF
jgi:hypothetical protein